MKRLHELPPEEASPATDLLGEALGAHARYRESELRQARVAARLRAIPVARPRWTLPSLSLRPAVAVLVLGLLGVAAAQTVRALWSRRPTAELDAAAPAATRRSIVDRGAPLAAPPNAAAPVAGAAAVRAPTAGAPLARAPVAPATAAVPAPSAAGAPAAAARPAPRPDGDTLFRRGFAALRARHDPVAALPLLERYIRRFPDGLFIEEAYGLAIEASARASTASAAPARSATAHLAADYLARFPGGRFASLARAAQRGDALPPTEETP